MTAWPHCWQEPPASLSATFAGITAIFLFSRIRATDAPIPMVSTRMLAKSPATAGLNNKNPNAVPTAKPAVIHAKITRSARNFRGAPEIAMIASAIKMTKPSGELGGAAGLICTMALISSNLRQQGQQRDAEAQRTPSAMLGDEKYDSRQRENREYEQCQPRRTRVPAIVSCKACLRSVKPAMT